MPASGARHVAAQRTPLTGGEAARALEAAWQELTGEAPADETLSILVGQWAHETGRGRAMLNYNFGGIKGSSPTGASTVYRTREGSGASEIQLQDRFRAYDSAEQGASDYLSLLARRYPDALQAAQRGDASGFVQALKSRGYFTGDEAAYSRSVSALARQALTAGFDALGARDPGPSEVRLRELGPSGTPANLAASNTLMAATTPAAFVSPLAALSASDAPLEAVQLPAGAWAHALSDEVTRVGLLISALQIGQPGEKEEG